jgi:hypothetical protein
MDLAKIAVFNYLAVGKYFYFHHPFAWSNPLTARAHGRQKTGFEAEIFSPIRLDYFGTLSQVYEVDNGYLFSLEV